jgi:hypothetical protein
MNLTTTPAFNAKSKLIKTTSTENTEQNYYWHRVSLLIRLQEKSIWPKYIILTGKPFKK